MRYLFVAIAILLLPIADVESQVESQTDRSLLIQAMAILPNNQPVEKELELQGYQLQEIQRLQIEFPEKLKANRQELAKTRGLERRKMMDVLYRDLEAELSRTLLPGQLKRVKEIALQSLALSADDGGLDIARLVSLRPVKSELEMSESEIRTLRQNAEAERQNLEREIKRLRNESRQRLLKTLSPERQEKLGGLTGRWFDFEGFVPGPDGKLSKPGSRNDH